MQFIYVGVNVMTCNLYFSIFFLNLMDKFVYKSYQQQIKFLTILDIVNKMRIE